MSEDRPVSDGGDKDDGREQLQPWEAVLCTFGEVVGPFVNLLACPRRDKNPLRFFRLDLHR